MEPSKLPLPLNLLQAATASQVSSLGLILPVIAQAIGSKTPNVDFTDFISRITDFEHRYTYWEVCNAAFRELHALNNDLIPALHAGKEVELRLTEAQTIRFEGILSTFEHDRILSFRRQGVTYMEDYGHLYGFVFTPLEKFVEASNRYRLRT